MRNRSNRRRSGATGPLLAYAVLFSLWLAISKAGDRFLPINAAYSPAIVAAILIFGIGTVALAVRVDVPERLRTLLFRLGGITFPLYLLHDRIGAVMINHAEPVIGAAPAVCLATAVSVGAAWIIFSYVEPVLKAACIQAMWTWPSGARLMGIRKPPHSVMMIPARPIESER